MDLVQFKHQIEVLNERANFYHIDIMDGHFVKNITLSPFFVSELNKISKVPIDVHLMVENPSDYLEVLAQAGASYITPHAETINKDAFRIIRTIKDLGCKVGVAVNPATPLEYIKPYIHLIDKLTIMTVDPGFAGQKFIPEMLSKIKQAKDWKKQFGYHYLIEADGSCNEKTFKQLAEAGTEVYIVGSSGLFNLNPEIEMAWDNMMQRFNEEVQSL